MTSKKDLAIEALNKEFKKMYTLVLEQLDLLESIVENETDDFEKTALIKLFENEEQLDKYEIILDSKIIQTIVLYKPMASDLRHIFALYRMMINLERIGDLVIKIYHNYKDLKGKKIIGKSRNNLLKMLRSTNQMTQNALLAFKNSQVEDAILAIKKDTDVDELNDKVIKKTLSKMKIDKDAQELVFNFIDVRAMVSSIERIGDQATNMAEAAIYAITGTNMAHKEL